MFQSFPRSTLEIPGRSTSTELPRGNSEVEQECHFVINKPIVKTLSAEEELFQDLSKMKSEGVMCQTNNMKRVLIIYASGSEGANSRLEIQRGFLKEQMKHNFYLCDSEFTRECGSAEYDGFLVSPPQDNGYRISYTVQEMERIDSSINFSLESVECLAQIIGDNYYGYDSFIVISGMDTMCYVGSALSFMLENLNKLVVVSGGLLPLSKMRNDSFNSLVECFSVVSEASGLNDVLIVCKNKGFRANRCKKFREGDFQNVFSPNLPAICSIKAKLRVRYSLFEQRSHQEFQAFAHMSRQVKALKIQMYECPESLEYDLANPHIKGYIIQAYSFANIPNNLRVLEIFKKAYEERKTVFISVSESVESKNQSLMCQYLEQFHIYFGADMTQEAALSKLAYLLAKEYPPEQIVKLMQTNLRGELTEQKEKFQLAREQVSLRDVVNEVLEKHYPTSLRESVLTKIQASIGSYISHNCTTEEFQSLFWSHRKDQRNNEEVLAKIVDRGHLLHQAVKNRNLDLIQLMIRIKVNVNQTDDENCSALYYALLNMSKSIIRMLMKAEARVIAPVDQLFFLFVEVLRNDDAEFFYLIYHMEFKDTLPTILNTERKSVAHIAAALRAEKCIRIIRETFAVPFNQPDIYGRTATHYLNREIK